MRDEVEMRKPAVVENSVDFIFAQDREFRYLSINSAAAAVIGRPMDVLVSSHTR